MRKEVLIFFTIMFPGAALGQPSPPHEVYGTVQTSGEAIEGKQVNAYSSGNIFDSTRTTDQDGSYSIKIPSDYQVVRISVEDGEKHEVNISSASVTELNLEAPGTQSTASGGSGGSGSGALPNEPAVSQNVRNETQTVQADLENNTATAEVDQVEVNKTVEVKVPENSTDSTVEEVSFTPGKTSEKQVSVELEELGREKPDEIETTQETSSNQEAEEVYTYQRIDVKGANDSEIQKAEINFKVNKSYLERKDRGPQEVVMQRYHEENWQKLDTRIQQELENAYRYKASSNGFSYYAVKLEEEKQEKEIRVKNLEVHKNTTQARINLELLNPRNSTLNTSIKLENNGETVSRNVILEPLQEKTLTYNRELEPGNNTFTVANRSKTVKFEPQKNDTEKKSRFYLEALLTVVLLLILTLIYSRKTEIKQEIKGLKDQI